MPANAGAATRVIMSELSTMSNMYGAALSIVEQVVFDAKPDQKFDVRRARLEIKRPALVRFRHGSVQRGTALEGAGPMQAAQSSIRDPRYPDCLGDAYRKATPPPRSGVPYRLEDHRRRTILDGRRTEATLDDLRGHAGAKRHVREDTVSGMLAGMDFDERRIKLTRPDGKSVSAYYDEESKRPLIEHRTLDDAERLCTRLNARLGLDRDAWWAIVDRSMRGAGDGRWH